MLLNYWESASACYYLAGNDIGTVTLSNSKKLNALSAALIADLLEAGKTERLRRQSGHLQGRAGVKVWSAGHDVNELPTNGRDPLTYDDPLRQAVRAIHETRMPVIAMSKEASGVGPARWSWPAISSLPPKGRPSR